MLEKILLIDDSPVVVKTLTRILQNDYSIFSTTDGDSGYKMAREVLPALILLDIIMPKTDGFQVMKYLKKDPVTAEIPVVFLTGLDNYEDEEKGFSAGAVDFIKKPFKPEIIKARVKTHVSLFSSNRQLAEERAYNKALLQRAETDPLTKLYNKEESRLRIEDCLKNANAQDFFALFMIDIDNFKGVNDNLGHQFGDAVLVDIASKIKNLFRELDIVGRTGGDEFVVFMRKIKHIDTIRERAEQLCEAFRQTYSGENNDYKISGSIGIALYPENGETFSELYHNADLALYESKHKGKDGYTLYQENIQAAVVKSVTRIEEAERSAASFYTDDIVYDIFNMLYETKDMRTTLNMVLGLIGKKFNLGRTSIFEHSEDETSVSKTFEWCAEGTSQEMEFQQEIPISELNFHSLFNKSGILCCNDFSVLDKHTARSLSGQGIQSFLYHAIYDNEKMIGYIAFDDCKEKRQWQGKESATLSYIARILSIFILNRRLAAVVHKQ